MVSALSAQSLRLMGCVRLAANTLGTPHRYYKLATGLYQTSRWAEACEMSLRAVVRLGRPMPTTRAGQIWSITKGLAALQYKAVTGGVFTIDASYPPNEIKTAYFQSHLLYEKMSFRIGQTKDNVLSMVASLCEGLTQENVPVAERIDQCLFMVVIAPTLGAKKLADLCIKEVNRLESECGDETRATFQVNFVNGYEYSRRGELKQSAAFFMKAAAAADTMAAITDKIDNTAWACHVMFENGLRHKTTPILKAAFDEVSCEPEPGR